MYLLTSFLLSTSFATILLPTFVEVGEPGGQLTHAVVGRRTRRRYEVGRFFGAVERLKRAAEEQNSREAQRAFAAMSVAYDRYLKVRSETRKQARHIKFEDPGYVSQRA